MSVPTVLRDLVHEAAEPEIDRVVGERIRALRREQGLSLETVAERCGVSIGFLSQIERGLSSPSLRVLTALADVLGVSFASLFVAEGEGKRGRKRKPANGHAGDADGAVVIRSGRRAKLKLWRSGIHKQLLTEPDADSRLSYFLMHMEPGATSGEELYSHSGREAGLVMEGRLRLTVGEETWDLERGDSFSFASNRPHRYVNAARGRTVIVMVHVPG